MYEASVYVTNEENPSHSFHNNDDINAKDVSLEANVHPGSPLRDWALGRSKTPLCEKGP